MQIFVTPKRGWGGMWRREINCHKSDRVLVKDFKLVGAWFNFIPKLI